jgi:hypothetical protein
MRGDHLLEEHRHDDKVVGSVLASAPQRGSLPVDRIAFWHAVIGGLLVSAFLAIQSIKLLTGRPFMLGLVPMFDLDAEANVPAFFQAQGLVAVGVATLIAAKHERMAGNPQAPRWTALALGFFYLGVDEAAMLHDRLGTAFQHAMRWAPDHADWIVPMFVIAAAFAVWMAPLVRSVPRQTAVDFALAGAVYLGGAVGIELVGRTAALANGYDSVSYVMSVAGEEGLEMLGIVLFLRAALLHLRRQGYRTAIDLI